MDVNIYLSQLDEGSPVHPQHVYVMIADEVVPNGVTPKINSLYNEMKGKGAFENVDVDMQPEISQYSGFRQFDVVDLDSELPGFSTG